MGLGRPAESPLFLPRDGLPHIFDEEKEEGIAMKNSFILYQDYEQHIQLLTDEQAGKLLKAIFAYNQGNPFDLDPVTKMAFSFIKAGLDRDNEKYQSILNRNKNNGLKGGRPKNQDLNQQENPNNPVGFLGTQNNPDEPKKADNDTDNENDNVSENETVKKKNIKKKKDESATVLDIPSYIPEDLLLDFFQHRKNLKKPMTDRAKELLISKIINLYNEGNDPTKLLETAIERGWQTVYETKETSGRKQNAENWNSGYSANGAEYQPFAGHQQDTGHATKLTEYERKILSVRRNLGLAT